MLQGSQGELSNIAGLRDDPDRFRPGFGHDAG